MNRPGRSWDYLLLTASNEAQAAAYRSQLEVRGRLGYLSGVRRVLVVPDPGGRRVGSGGSSITCLLEVLSRELGRAAVRADRAGREAVFRGLRILVVHAGGDSKRLPPYGPCGKVFVPLPGEAESAVGPTIFDRQLPRYLDLPAPPGGGGQVLITTGDVLLSFDAEKVRFADEGFTGVGCPADPRVARNHGVFAPHADGKVRLFLQKPSVEEQTARGAIDSHGQTVLDLGIINLDAAAAGRLLGLVDIRRGPRGSLVWRGPFAAAVEEHGLDLYREICCAMGDATTFAGYVAEVRRAGSTLPGQSLRAVFRAMTETPFHVCVVPRCGFFHFGTLRELYETGQNYLATETGISQAGACLSLNNEVRPGGALSGKNAWVEGCRLRAPLRLEGDNVVTGVDVDEPTALPAGACLDVLAGRGRDGRTGWFVRVYGVDDLFHVPARKGGRLAGLTLAEWLKALGVRPEDVWNAETPVEERAVWNGRFFPFVARKDGWRDWLWLSRPAGASAEEKRAWRAAERYSLSDMSRLASQAQFHERRLRLRAAEIRRSFRRVMRAGSDFSASELALLWRNDAPASAAAWVVEALEDAHRRFRDGRTPGRPSFESLELPRLLHTLGSAINEASSKSRTFGRALTEALGARLSPDAKDWLASLGAPVAPRGRRAPLASWAAALREAAFTNLGRTIVYSRERRAVRPQNALRSDEIVWGRSPARLDLGGGWTDTPPYALERGGSVINAAVDLNGQSPIQVYLRVIPEPEIRLNSIDHSERVVVRDFDGLVDFRQPDSRFGLAKAALVLSGFGPGDRAGGISPRSLAHGLERFGGGIELTTLAAIPSGSGLGTSSIMGAVLLSVVNRLLGRALSPRELFHAVLQLEQELTTGGGWQDQVGGVLPGVKVIGAEPGLIPDPRIHYVPTELLDPRANGGQTLLYYTGLRRLAKNILHEVVGRYLDRDRAALETLRRLHAFPPLMAEAMARHDMRRFGELIDYAWRLNVELDPHHTNAEIEAIRARVARRVWGAKLLGAGGGGFLLLVGRSVEDAAALRRELEAEPPNAKARFFDYEINRSGLVVTVC